VPQRAKEDARPRVEPGASGLRACAVQIRPTLNGAPLIEAAAIAERNALAKVRIIFSPCW
jgi:hypothetical protein